MKCLVINCAMNELGKIRELVQAISAFSKVVEIRFRDINAYYEVAGDIDAVVLSGSKARIVEASHRDHFKETVELIKRVDVPKLGICYGYQLVCWSLGSQMASLKEPVLGRFEDVRILETDDLFQGFKKYQIAHLAQSHNDYVEKYSVDSAGLVLLADSPSCEVEAVKHRKSAFYGVQFHPERTKIGDQVCSEGQTIIKNFFNIVRK
jgi:GMP synthase-like glutamine amidotransferase